MNKQTWDKVYNNILDTLTEKFMTINGFPDREKALEVLLKATQEVKELNTVYKLEEEKK